MELVVTKPTHAAVKWMIEILRRMLATRMLTMVVPAAVSVVTVTTMAPQLL
jgi:hypothetical protein